MSDKWTLLITGSDHGLVGAFGNQFAAHPGWYGRVDVVRADNHAKLVEALRMLLKDPNHPIVDANARTLLAQLEGE